ncbi:MAG: histidine--tRNA ligase [Thermoplasmata archaeon]
MSAEGRSDSQKEVQSSSGSQQKGCPGSGSEAGAGKSSFDTKLSSTRPIGTRDFLPDDMQRREWLYSFFSRICSQWGYRQIQTPTFEHLDLFIARSGEGIKKELYDFMDKGGRWLTLRPELTAPVLRAYAESMQGWPKPVKLFYFGNCFRYERPQAGRYREFWQFGTEIIGSGTPESSATTVALAAAMLSAAGLRRLKIRLGHVGLLKVLAEHAKMEETDRKAMFPLIDKKDISGLEVVTAKYPEDRCLNAIRSIVLQGEMDAPLILKQGDNSRNHLKAEDRPDVPADRTAAVLKSSGLESEVLDKALKALDEFREIATLLESMIESMPVLISGTSRAGNNLKDLKEQEDTDKQWKFCHDFGIARGLDYYTGMVFEIEAEDLGAQKQICGGGAYSLDAVFGIPPTPSVGFGIGFDRVLLALDKTGISIPAVPRQVYVVPVGKEAVPVAMSVAGALLAAGFNTELELNRRSLGKSMKYADEMKFQVVLMLGENEINKKAILIREMSSGKQTEVAADKIVEALTKILKEITDS